MIRVVWKKPISLSQEGKRKKLMVSIAIVKSHTGRFLLYQTSGEGIPSMWTLWDREKEVQHFLYGVDLKGAKLNAVTRIRELLKK